MTEHHLVFKFTANPYLKYNSRLRTTSYDVGLVTFEFKFDDLEKNQYFLLQMTKNYFRGETYVAPPS